MSKRITFLVLLAIIGLGVFLRFYQIAEIPLGLYPDEAMNGNNALEAIHNTNFFAEGGPTFGWKVFYPENNGREGLFINLQAVSLKVFGNKPWALRLVSAIFGTLTILGVYLLSLELFWTPKSQITNHKSQTNPNDQNFNNQTKRVWNFKNWSLFGVWSLEFGISRSQAIALLSSFFLATSYWHLNFSRIGFRAILLPFFAAFGLYFLLKGLRQGKITSLVWAGVFTGLGFYSYIAFRFMPFVLAIPLIWYLWQWHRQNQKSKIKNQNEISKSKNIISCTPCAIILFLLITFVVALPIGWYFFQNPQDFIGRSGQVSIFSAVSPLKEFLKSNLLTLQMFFWQGDCNWRHNYACRPELNLLVAIFFIIGLALAVRHVKHSVLNITLLGWFAFMTLPATLTKESLPHALRSIGLIPPVIIFAGLGAYWLGQKILSFFEKQKTPHQIPTEGHPYFLQNHAGSPTAPDFKNIESSDRIGTGQVKWPGYLGQLERIQKELIVLFILVLLLIPLATYRDYFLRWAGNPKTYSAFSTDLLNLGRFLNNLPQDTKKYVVVNLSGADIRGIPAPAQTVMFATDTFREDARRQKNIIYVTRENWTNILQVLPNQKVLIAFLDGADRQLIHTIEKQFTGLKIKVPGDFVVLQNY